jgi:lipoyl(octanoyl) transferase
MSPTDMSLTDMSQNVTVGGPHLRYLGTDVPYEDAWRLQRELHAKVCVGAEPDTVLLLEHVPVFTAGRRTQPTDWPLDGSPVVQTDRGGRITWHGPGQLVGYPIVRLASPIDVVAYVRRLESLLIDLCAEFGVSAGRVEGRSGVWVAQDGGGPQRKIAAIGVRVAQGVTMHGFALNVNPDLSWFARIVPCGISDAGVTSLAVETDVATPMDTVRHSVRRMLPLSDLPGRRPAS